MQNKMVRVEWLDSCIWAKEDTLKNILRSCRPVKMVTFGLLIEKTKDFVIVTREMNYDNNSCRGTIVIPWKDIVSVKYYGANGNR